GSGLVAQAFDVSHSDNTRTLAFRFTTAEGGSMVYAPDVGQPLDSKLARGADVLVLDGSSRERTVKGHMPMTEGIEMGARRRASRVLFTHIGHRTGTHAQLEAWLGERAAPAWDGLEVEF